jgi:hypothetical protein
MRWLKIIAAMMRNKTPYDAAIHTRNQLQHGSWVLQLQPAQIVKDKGESYWMDAAYVAERILTVDELKAYVDRNWPEVPLPPLQKQMIANDDTNMPSEYWNGWWYQDSVTSADETDPATSRRPRSFKTAAPFFPRP